MCYCRTKSGSSPSANLMRKRVALSPTLVVMLLTTGQDPGKPGKESSHPTHPGQPKTTQLLRAINTTAEIQ